MGSRPQQEIDLWIGQYSLRRSLITFLLRTLRKSEAIRKTRKNRLVLRVGLEHLAAHDQLVAVLHQEIPVVTQFGFLAIVSGLTDPCLFNALKERDVPPGLLDRVEAWLEDQGLPMMTLHQRGRIPSLGYRRRTTVNPVRKS